MDRQETAETTIRTFFNDIADPSIFSGGGSVAAVAAAGAASTALLVMRLNARRKRNADFRATIDEGIERTSALVDALLLAADQDIATLQRLLTAQRERKEIGGGEHYAAVLREAAEGPIVIAELAGELLSAIIPQMEITTRFTISDLGAAAVLAEGAARAALMTSEVNIALLRDLDPAPVDAVRELEHRRDVARTSIVDLADRIERASREAIHGIALTADPISEDISS